MAKIWIARDLNGTLCLYTGEPHRKDNHWDYTFRAVDYCELDKNLYPEITWENSPQSFEIISSKEFERLKSIEEDWLKLIGYGPGSINTKSL